MDPLGASPQIPLAIQHRLLSPADIEGVLQPADSLELDLCELGLGSNPPKLSFPVGKERSSDKR